MPRATISKKKKNLSLYVHKPAPSVSTVTTVSKTGYLRSIKLQPSNLESEVEVELELESVLPEIPDESGAEFNIYGDISPSKISGITVKLPAKRYLNS
ncbi:hypothetical protein H0H92_013589, partial [Tricholoma furcatifolium]